MIGLIVGHPLNNTPQKELIKDTVTLLAIATIYPAMIELDTKALTKGIGSWREVTLSLIYIYVISPFLAIPLSKWLSRDDGTGFVASNVVPASSSSMSHVLLSGREY